MWQRQYKTRQYSLQYQWLIENNEDRRPQLKTVRNVSFIGLKTKADNGYHDEIRATNRVYICLQKEIEIEE